MSDPLLGRTLGHFKIDSKLGQGGMAMVYRAHQTNLNRDVALKILPPEMTFDQSYIARFQQEARAAAGLEHSHIVPIFEIGDADGFYYIAMKYIEGGTLKETIDREAPLGLARVLELLEPVGRALDYAHKKGVVHRDIKPSNVMITPEGWVYLTDFGLARGNSEGTAGLTQAGTIMGTPEYMSPEQAQGLTVGPRSDVYALAIMVYEMLSHGMPFTGDNPQSVLFARVMRAPKPPSEYLKTIPSRIEDVLMKALARQPEARFESAAAMFAALRTAGGIGAERKESPSKPPAMLADEKTIVASRPSYPPPNQPSYPPQDGQSNRPPSQPSYPPQGQSYPPQGGQYNRPPSQPSYPPPNQPSYPPPSQPSYPPQDQSYPPQGGYVAGPAHQSAANYNAPMQPANYNQPHAPSYPPPAQPYAPPAQAKRGRNIWLGLLALLVLVGGGIGAYFAFAGGGAAKAIANGNAAFERKGGLAEAQTAFNAAITNDDRNFEAHERLALTYLMRGKPEDAERVANQAINIQPEQVAPHVWLSQAYSDQRKYNESLAQAEESVRLEPNNALAFVARASARADLGLQQNDEDLLNDALADADRAIEIAQTESLRLNQALAYNAKGYVQWQLYQYKTSRDNTAGSELVDDGIDQFNRAIGLQEQLPTLHTNLGYFYAQQGYVADYQGDSSAATERFGKANAAFDAAIALDGEYGAAYAGKGWAAIDQRDYEGSIGLFDAALARNPNDANALVGRGLAHWWLGTLGLGDSQQDYQTAADNYEAALTEAPTYLSAYVDLGSIYLYSLNDTAKAEDTYRRALAQDPNYGAALAGVGDVLYAQNYYVEAIAQYDAALAINPEIAYAHLGKANSQAALNQYAESLASYDLALQYNTTLTNAYVGKAIAQNQLGDPAGARATLEGGLNEVRVEDQPTLQTELDALP